MPYKQPHRQNHLQVVRWMQSVTVVALVTVPKHLKVYPTDEGEHADKNRIQCFGAKHSPMAEFVHRVQKKGADHPVCEYNWNHRPNGKSGGCNERRDCCQSDCAQVSQ